MVSQGQRWEVGSEFHWMDIPHADSLPWPVPHVWYARGRDAVPEVVARYGWEGRALWVPDFFCPHVVANWRQCSLPVYRYADDPRLPEPNWNSLTPAPGELVLAVNTFGVRGGDGWHRWRRTHPDTILFEDHTHDPFSRWARESAADFAFASLRKVFAAPDGGLLWSPAGHELPQPPLTECWTGSSQKLAAMLWKREYLDGRGNDAVKEAYRRLQIEGERLLGEGPVTRVSPWSHALLAGGYPTEWRRRREANAVSFLDLMARVPGVEPLFQRWPAGHCPFNVILAFASEELSQRCFERLRAARIYSPVHWQLTPEAPEPLRRLSLRLRTIPVDQRYDESDLRTIFGVLCQALYG